MIDPAGWAQAAAQRADAAGDDRTAVRGALLPLLRDPAWLADLAAQALSAMRDDPLHRPQFAASRHGFIGHLALARAGRVSVGVTLIAGAAARGPDEALPHPQVSFSGQWTLSRLLSRDPLRIRRASLAEDGGLRVRHALWQQRTLLDLDERRQAVWIAPPPRAACVLRVRVAPRRAIPVRAFDLASRRPLATVQGDEAAARANMLMSVLRALGAREAVPLFADRVERGQGAARWQAMREWLALDAASAWPRLAHMAAVDPDEAVRRAATDTLARFAPRQAA